MRLSGRYVRYVPRVTVFVVLLSVVAGMVLFVRDMLNSGTPQGKKAIQQISLIQPPLPPPPPPKIEEKPPEPEIKEEVKTPEPDPEPQNAADDAPLPGDDLALDAEGGAGGDGFGLLGKKGGRDLIGGGAGSPFAWYSNMLQRDILDVLSENDRVRAQRYSVIVKLWILPDGKISKAELASSSGSKDVDASLRVALAGMDRLSEKPPDDLPQPVKLKITSRL